MSTNEEIWNMKLPSHLITRHVTPWRLPKTRKEWSKNIYNMIYAVEESTVNWDEGTILILDEAILYFETYNMPILAWWTKELKKQILHPELRNEERNVNIDANTLRGIFHDEMMDPIKCLHTKETRETIKRAFEIRKEEALK